MKRVIILVRASSAKQASDGDSLEHQLQQCRHYIKKHNWKEVKYFPFIESGAKEEREFFNEVLDFALDKKNKIDIVVFKHINRFTRGGGIDYLKWKNKLESGGIRITDTYGTIGEKINTLDHLDLEYSWSVTSPTESNEIVIANQARDDRRNILTQMIGAEVTYIRQGYYPRPPTYGYSTKKIETKDGRRTILVEVPEESFYVKKMFEMRAKGFTMKEIANEVNKLGYKSRIRNKRDPKTKVMIGKIGGKPIAHNRIGEILSRTVYTGVICETWTKFQPIKAKFPGFIDIDLFNQANKDKILIQIKDDRPYIFYDAEASTEKNKKRITKHNPLYPFKKVVLCPICRSDLRGSASTNRTKTKYPKYHCSKGHKQWSVPANEFNKTIYNFINQIEFNDEDHKLLEALFHRKWDAKRVDVMEVTHKKESHVVNLVAQQRQVMDNLKATPLDKTAVRNMLMEEVEELEIKLKKARKSRDIQVKKEINAKLGFKHAKFFMEHIEELLIDTKNVRRQQQLFGMMFNELPTYDQIVDGTTSLTEYFRINKEKIRSCEPERNRTVDLLRDRETC